MPSWYTGVLAHVRAATGVVAGGSGRESGAAARAAAAVATATPAAATDSAVAEAALALACAIADAGDATCGGASETPPSGAARLGSGVAGQLHCP